MSSPKPDGGAAFPLEIGQYVVVRGSFRDEVGMITKITPQYIWKKSSDEKRDWRADRSAVVFTGSEEDGKRLIGKLASSAALCQQERNSALDRKRERDKKLIADAMITARQS